MIARISPSELRSRLPIAQRPSLLSPSTARPEHRLDLPSGESRPAATPGSGRLLASRRTPHSTWVPRYAAQRRGAVALMDRPEGLEQRLGPKALPPSPDSGEAARQSRSTPA